MTVQKTHFQGFLDTSFNNHIKWVKCSNLVLCAYVMEAYVLQKWVTFDFG